MDEKLKKLLEDAQRQGASDADLKMIIQMYEKDNPPVKKKEDSPAFAAVAAGGTQAVAGGTEKISPSTSPLKSTSEEDLNKDAMTDYLQGLKDPANTAVTKDQIALNISKQRPLLQINKDGSKAKTKDEGIAETAEKIQADRNRRIQEVQGAMQDGSATKEDVVSLYDYEEARPFLQSYINAYSDKDKIPATGDVLTPGEHWESAWKNSTAENRPLAVQKIDAAVKYADSLINSALGSVIEYSQASSFAKVFPGGDDESFQETIAGVDVNNPEALSQLKNKLTSQVLDVKDATGKSIPVEKRAELLKAIEYKINDIERKKPLAEELKEQEFSDKLYHAIGEVEHGLHEITTNNLTKRESNTDERKYSAVIRGLNYYKSIEPGLYTNVVRAINNNGEIAEGDYQQLLSKGQQLENFNTFVGGATNKDLIGAETNFNLDTRGSIVAKRSGALGETAKQFGLANKMSYSDAEIDLLNKKTDWAAYGMRPPTETELDLIKTNEGKWFYDQIPKTGAVSAFVRGVEQPFLAIARSVEDATTSSASDVYLRSKQLDRRTSGEQLTPDEKGQYGAGLASDRGNVWYTIMEGAGSFLPQILLTRGLGAPVSGAAKIAAGSIPRAALTAEQLFTVNTTAGTLLSSYLQGYGDSYERALQTTGDPAKAEVIGNIGGIIDGVMEQWLPETRIGQGILRNLKGDIAERIATVVRKGGDLDEVLESTKGLLKPFVSQYLNVTGQEMAEEGTGVLLKQLAESIVSPQTAMNNDVASELGQVLISTALQTFIPAITSGAASAKNRFTKQVFSEAAAKFDYTKDALIKAKNLGTISPEEYNQSISLLKTQQNSLVTAPKVDANGAKINSQDRSEYAYQETLIKINEEKATKSTSVEKELLDKKIDDSKAIQRSILMPTPPSESAPSVKNEPALTPEKTSKELRDMAGDEKADLAITELREIVDADTFPDAVQPIEKTLAKERPLQFLKTISEQLYQPPININGKDVSPEDGLVNKYGKEVVDLARTTFIPEGITLIDADQKSPTVKLSVDGATPVQEPLTKEEEKDWNSLTMEEKRALATQNLPEVEEDTEDAEMAKLADENAKFLLARMRGEEISRPIPLQVTPSTEPATATPVEEVVDSTPTTNEDVSSGEAGSVGVVEDTKYPHTIYKGDVSELKTDGDGVSFFTRDKDAADYYTTSREQQGVSKGNKTFEGNIITKNPLIVDANKPSPIELKDKDGNVLGIFGQGDYVQKVKDAGYDAIIVNRKFGTPLDGWEIVSFDRKQIVPKAVEQSLPTQEVKDKVVGSGVGGDVDAATKEYEAKKKEVEQNNADIEKRKKKVVDDYETEVKKLKSESGGKDVSIDFSKPGTKFTLEGKEWEVVGIFKGNENLIQTKSKDGATRTFPFKDERFINSATKETGYASKGNIDNTQKIKDLEVNRDWKLSELEKQKQSLPTQEDTKPAPAKPKKVSPAKKDDKDPGKEPIKLSDDEKVKLKMTLEEKIAALQKLKIKSQGLQSNIFGIPIFVYNSAIDTVIVGLRAGDSLTKAINKAIEKYKLYNYKNFKRDKFINQFEDNLGEEYEYGNEEEQEQNKKSSKAGPNFTRPESDAEGGSFNFFKNRDLTESGVDLRYLSGDTIEEGTGKKITGVFNYDAKTLDGLLEVGQRWMAAAKAQFNKNATQYAEVLLKNLQDMKGRSAVKAVAMVNLLNTIDKDLKTGDLTKGQRDILKFVRRELIEEIAENAREGSLTLNAQRLIHKLYKGEYKFTETMAGIVTNPVQKKATNVSEKMKKGSTEISETVRKQARSGKTPARPATKKEESKKAKSKTYFEKLTKGMSPENIAKLKSKISEIANGLNCRKKK